MILYCTFCIQRQIHQHNASTLAVGFMTAFHVKRLICLHSLTRLTWTVDSQCCSLFPVHICRRHSSSETRHKLLTLPACQTIDCHGGEWGVLQPAKQRMLIMSPLTRQLTMLRYILVYASMISQKFLVGKFFSWELEKFSGPTKFESR